MTLNIIQVNDLQLITCVKTGVADELLVYCHDKKTELSYTETLPVDQFMQRIRQLNKRIHFPIKTVRTTVCSASPTEAILSLAETEVVKKECAEEEENAVAEKALHTVLCLKYRIEGAPAPLKWEWHLTAMDSAQFFRTILMDALYAASSLKNNVNSLLDVIKKKDVELKQFREEGFNLRRTTVITEPFDVPAFETEHKQMLINAELYGQAEQLLNNSVVVKQEIAIESLKSTNVPTTIPGSSDQLISPRARKRKAIEAGVQHMERKALQRRLVPQLQYKNSQSQSQESDVDEEPKLMSNYEVELAGISADLAENMLKVENEQEEFNEFMKIINSAAD